MVAIILLSIVLILRHHYRQQAAQQQTQGQGRGGRTGGSSSARLPGGAARGGGAGGSGGPVAVAVAPVSSGDINVRIPALGTVTPLATVTVRSQVSGILQKVAFQEGQLVHAGDFLAQIDARPFQAALTQAEGMLRRDQAQLADAQLDLKRYEELVKEDSIAQQQLDTQRALVKQYAGTIEADQGAVSTARVNLAYTHIVSPVNGRVGLRQVDQGNYVTPGDTNGIVVVTQLQPITVIFSVPEDYVTPLMKRLHDGDILAAVAYDRGNANKLAEGKVLTLDNQIDTTTGTIRLRALFDNSDGALFANQFVNIQLVQDTLHNQTIIPSAAVRRGAPNGVLSTFVYLVNATASTVSVRPVTLGVADGERVAVTQGLQPGDEVVTEGGDRLRDGAPVLLPAATPQHAMRPAAQPAGAQNAPGNARRQRRQPAGAPSSSNPPPTQGTTGAH